MTLPSHYIASLLLLILSMLCWGSWANTFKATGKWRFELFYFDFAAGVFGAAFFAAATFGTFGPDGFSVLDELQISGLRHDAYAFLAGVVFNLANMLLVAAISVAGMTVAFPVGIGLALIIGVALSFYLHPVGSPYLLGAGCVAILLAIVFDSIAWRTYSSQMTELAKEAAAAQQAAQPLKAKVKGKKKASSASGLVLAVVGGILMGLFYPLVELAKQGEYGLGPYTVGLIFAAAVLFSTFVFNLFFMNLPVQGPALSFSDYFAGKGVNHLLGFGGGFIWFGGAIFNFVAARAEGPALVGPAVSYAMGQGATLITALWGLIVWKEFAGAGGTVRVRLAVMLALFVAGLLAVSVAPLYGR
jgi:glucose uptake protein